MFFPMDWPDWGETESWIKINGQSLPLGAGQGVQQTYEKEEMGQLERALDGGLVFMGIPDLGFRLATTLSCDGYFVPHMFMLNPWDQVELECGLPLYMPGQVDPADLIRPHVAGSIRYFENAQRGDQFYLRAIGGEGMAADPRVVWTGFRPKLIVHPVSSSYSGNEFSKKKSWSWDFREHKDAREL